MLSISLRTPYALASLQQPLQTLLLVQKSTSARQGGPSPRRLFSSVRKSDPHLHSDSSAISTSTLTLSIPTPEDMEELGSLLSVTAKPGDVILMDGDLGAGKTCLSRGFIHFHSQVERVTSPTYLLCQVYPTTHNFNIHHMDLYRLDGTPDALIPLNLPHVFHHHVSLIEWPTRLGNLLPESRLEIDLNIKQKQKQKEELGYIDAQKKSESGIQKQSASDDDDDDDHHDPSLSNLDCVERVVTIRPIGQDWAQRIQHLEQYMEDWMN